MEKALESKMDLLWEQSVKDANEAKAKGVFKVPESSNGLGLAKWFGKTIEEITACIDQSEIETNVHCVCQKGCDSCCKQAIQVLPTEAKAIAVVIHNFSPEEKQHLGQKVKAWLEAVEKSGLDTDQNKYYAKGAASDAIYEFMDQYFKLGLRCPLLSDEGACTIYKVRPGGCWSYRVYSSPEECKKAYYAPGGMKHDVWERYLLDKLFMKVKPDHKMKLLPYYIIDILNHKL